MIADGLRIVMLGAPGAGKGTQAQRMVSHFGIPQISTGEIFRENLKRNTPLGREIKEFMEKGELVPDDIVLKIVEERLSHGDCAKGFILDGFPRTLSCGNAGVLIGGRIAPVIGRICMDQLMVDITGIEGVRAGDTAVLIGSSADSFISAPDIAESYGSISNELLARMGARLPVVVKNVK